MMIPGEHEMEFRLGYCQRVKGPALYFPDPPEKVRRQVVVNSSVVLLVAGKPWNRETEKILEKG